MTFNDYQQQAKKTAIYTDSLRYPTLGLCGEVGELANKVKKIYRDHDGQVTAGYRAVLLDELSDVLWYVAAIASDLNCDLDLVAKHNLDKLSDRARRDKISGEGDGR